WTCLLRSRGWYPTPPCARCCPPKPTLRSFIACLLQTSPRRNKIPKPLMLTVQELVNENTDKISFTWIAGMEAADRVIANDGLSGADLVGHLNPIHPARVQVFATAELAYYARVDPRRRHHHLGDLVTGGVPAIIVAGNLTVPDDLQHSCT